MVIEMILEVLCLILVYGREGSVLYTSKWSSKLVMCIDFECIESCVGTCNARA